MILTRRHALLASVSLACIWGRAASKANAASEEQFAARPYTRPSSSLGREQKLNKPNIYEAETGPARRVAARNVDVVFRRIAHDQRTGKFVQRAVEFAVEDMHNKGFSDVKVVRLTEYKGDNLALARGNTELAGAIKIAPTNAVRISSVITIGVTKKSLTLAAKAALVTQPKWQLYYASKAGLSIPRVTATKTIAELASKFGWVVAAAHFGYGIGQNIAIGKSIPRALLEAGLDTTKSVIIGDFIADPIINATKNALGMQESVLDKENIIEKFSRSMEFTRSKFYEKVQEASTFRDHRTGMTYAPF
jgi:hypothetical protein